MNHAEIEATLPEAAGAGYLVEVTVGDSIMAPSLAIIDFNLPQISEVIPTSGSTIGGTVLTIRGAEFGPETSIVSVQVGDGGLAISCDVLSHNGTMITCSTNAGLASGLPVFVTVEAQTNPLSPHIFDFNAPVLYGVKLEPGQTWETIGGFMVQIEGENLHPSTIVYFNDTAVPVIAFDATSHEVRVLLLWWMIKKFY